MFSRLENLFKFVDETVSDIYSKHPEEVTCEPGCADCCHATFDVSFIEAAFLASHLKQKPEVLESQQSYAEQAAVAYEEMVKSKKDPAKTRIRCPLLSDESLCLAHPYRPINCRTYGTPTLFEGTSHVCGISKFSDSGKYATIDLAPLQKSLHEYSIELVGEDFGMKRFPIAWVILRTDFFLPPDLR